MFCATPTVAENGAVLTVVMVPLSSWLKTRVLRPRIDFSFFYQSVPKHKDRLHDILLDILQAMRKKSNKDLRHMSKMELEVRRQKAATARKVTQVRWIVETLPGGMFFFTDAQRGSFCIEVHLPDIHFASYYYYYYGKWKVETPPGGMPFFGTL